jgi:hypothetical protein
VSVTDDAPVVTRERRRTVRLPGPARRTSPWWWLVAACALILALTGAAMTAWWATTRETRITSYRALGDLSEVRLDVGAADVHVEGGGSGAVEVRRTDRFAFGNAPHERRALAGAVLRVSSRCPDELLRTCRSAYRVTVPDNVAVTVRTSSGRVTITGLRASTRVTTGSGGIAASAFCGFSLRAASESGDVSAAAECSPDRLALRSGSGDVQAALPPGRYQVDASSDSGERRVRGVTVADDAPFAVQALSGSGNVSVEGTR